MIDNDRLDTLLYIHNEDKSILYFSGINSDFAPLGIHVWNLNVSNHIDTDSLYLDNIF